MRNSKNQLLGLGCVGAALVGITLLLQVSAWWAQTPAPDINPLAGILQIILGRVKVPTVTWVLIVLLVVAALVVYLRLSDPSDQTSGRGHMVKTG